MSQGTSLESSQRDAVELAALKRAAFTQLAICERAIARLDDPSLSARERDALNFQLRQGIEYTDRLLAISGGKAAPL